MFWVEFHSRLDKEGPPRPLLGKRTSKSNNRLKPRDTNVLPGMKRRPTVGCRQSRGSLVRTRTKSWEGGGISDVTTESRERVCLEDRWTGEVENLRKRKKKVKIPGH